MTPPRIFTLGDPARAATRIDLDEVVAIMTRRNTGPGPDYAVGLHFRSSPAAVMGAEEADVRALLDAFDAWTAHAHQPSYAERHYGKDTDLGRPICKWCNTVIKDDTDRVAQLGIGDFHIGCFGLSMTEPA